MVAASLHLDVAVNDELREHERPSLPFAASRDAFESALATAFARPTDTIYGGESVEGARSRFASAIARILASPGDGTPLVVTHGTVLASYVASVTGCDPVPLWRGLDLPSWLALDLVAGAIVDSWRVTPHP